LHLTIAYITSRANSRITWFLDSLKKQGGFSSDVSVVVVDRVGNSMAVIEQLLGVECSVPIKPEERWNGAFIRVTRPKPCVWQGEHRLTKEDWFAASNARNTALCLALDGWIAYVDDLSVLLPTWLDAVKEAMRENWLVCGAYKKVKNLVVEDGLVKSFEEFPGGIDARWNRGSDSKAVPIGGHEMFGCSCAMPVEALLQINGWPEVADGLGFEDCITGIVLNNAGYGFRYDRRMCTYESAEAHEEEPSLKKRDKGKSPLDKSHAVLRIAKQSKNWPNFFGPEGIRGLRQRVLDGEAFPIMGIPTRDWYDGALISEM
jgi:glycosyltransferase involved in cell wall biosynthesis